ncbi:MAG: NUDIX hydrolase [Nitrospirae bacterium]|nr:NUDIX hydrolase [Nitrospirota bacterium]
MLERKKGLDPQWLIWAKQLQAIAQTGLTYCRDAFDIERYEQVREIAAEIAAVHSDMEPKFIRNLFASEQGHATPKVDVRGAIFKDESILLVKERLDGKWTLPGGWADINESPGEAVVREVFEETGYETRAVKLLAIFDRNRHGHTPYPFNAYKLFFMCEMLGGIPSQSMETAGSAFFGEDELPDLSLPRITRSQIIRMFEHYRHPNWPTDFD